MSAEDIYFLISNTYRVRPVVGVSRVGVKIDLQCPQLTIVGEAHFVATQVRMTCAGHHHVFTPVKHQSYWAVHSGGGGKCH